MPRDGIRAWKARRLLLFLPPYAKPPDETPRQRYAHLRCGLPGVVRGVAARSRRVAELDVATLRVARLRSLPDVRPRCVPASQTTRVRDRAVRLRRGSAMATVVA